MPYLLGMVKMAKLVCRIVPVLMMLLVLCIQVARADDAEPNADCNDLLSVVDRPSFGVNPCTVPIGDVLVESGYMNVRGGDAGISSYPQTQVRFGATPRLDFTLTLPSMNLTPAGGSFDALGAGFKYRFLTGDFQLATFATIETPVGASGTATLVSGIAGSRDFGRRLGGEMTIAYDAQGRSLLGSAEVSLHIGDATEGFVELARATLSGSTPVAVFDFGVQTSLTRYLAIDIEAGRTLAPIGTRQSFVGFGLAFGHLRAVTARH